MLGPGCWGDVIITEAPDYLQKGDAKMMEVHTLRECSAPDCKRGVRNQYAVLGMCVECAEGELKRLQGIEEAATTAASGHKIDAYGWRMLAAALRGTWPRWAYTVDAIADALEVE